MFCFRLSCFKSPDCLKTLHTQIVKKWYCFLFTLYPLEPSGDFQVVICLLCYLLRIYPHFTFETSILVQFSDFGLKLKGELFLIPACV